MFGIGGGEIFFILLVVLMLFGAEKIPDVARTLGKLMAQLKNATNDIKSEIQKGVDGVGADSTFSEISSEINKAKDNFIGSGNAAVTKMKADIEEVTGPIKRQL